MINYRKALRIPEQLEHEREYGRPFRPSDATQWERSGTNNAVGDDGLHQDLATLKQLMGEGRLTECEPIIERLGTRYSAVRLPRSQRPVCGAMTRKGVPCRAKVVWIKGEPLPRKRCRNHGGLSTGPVTAEGRAAIAESNRRRQRR